MDPADRRPTDWPPPVAHGRTFEGFASPPGGPTTSGLAIASLVFGILGGFCVTGLAGLALGLAALVSIAGAPHLRKGRGLAIAGIVLSVLWFAVIVAAGLSSPELRQRLSEPSTVAVSPPPVPGPLPVPIPGIPTIPTIPTIPNVPGPGGGARTALTPAAGPLEVQLRAQLAAAEGSGRRLVVFFTATWCAPCLAVERTLSAPDLVVRLAAVQLVEVDVDQFPDLGRVAPALVGRDVTAIPLLCTMRSTLPPVCMDGGAWGEDSDVNIRSILVPFLETPPSGLADQPSIPIPI